MKKADAEKLFEELITQQRQRLYELARTQVPHITPEDILQPFDFPELENFGPFRYEEGILEGLLSAQAALLYDWVSSDP